MIVKYIGPFKRVAVDLPDGGAICKRDETVEVDDSIGASLLEQAENWSEVTRTVENKSAPVVPAPKNEDVEHVA